MAVVNRIEKVRRHLVAHVDGEQFSLPYAFFRAHPLREGQEVDLEAYRALLARHQAVPAMEYAGSLLAAKEYASGEMKAVLVRRGFLPETADQVVRELCAHAFIDDARFARAFAASRTAAGYGRVRIRQDLKKKGIPDSLLSEVMETSDASARHEAMLRLARQGFLRSRPGEGRRKAGERVLGLLVRRGYTFDEARGVISECLETMDPASLPSEPTDEERIASAKTLVEKTLARHQGEDERELHRKILSALSRKGYPYALAREALRQALENADIP